jgi:CBS domain-containing protein
MQNPHQIRHLMVALSEYVTVDQDATLAQAIAALAQAQDRLGPGRHRHRAALVTDAEGRVVGKVSQVDVLRALAPRLSSQGRMDAITRLGFNPEFIQSASDSFGLREGPLSALARRAESVRVRDIMTTPTAREFVEESASLEQAIDQLALGKHQSLLVTRGDDVVGILRLTDVFAAICSELAGRREAGG